MNVQVSDKEITFTRLLDAPRDLVWRVWTDPEHVAKWWGPDEFGSVGCDIDLRVGGTFLMRMRAPNGMVIPSTGTFKEIVPPEKLVLEGPLAADTACGAGLPPKAVTTLTLEDLGGRTKMTLCTRFETANGLQAAQESGLSESWPQSFDRMAGILSNLTTP